MLLKAFHTQRLERNLGIRYGTHSIKSTRASNPACRSISADLLDMHAGWKCAISMNSYIKHTFNDRLKVARSTAL